MLQRIKEKNLTQRRKEDQEGFCFSLLGVVAPLREVLLLHSSTLILDGGPGQPDVAEGLRLLGEYLPGLGQLEHGQEQPDEPAARVRRGEHGREGQAWGLLQLPYDLVHV